MRQRQQERQPLPIRLHERKDVRIIPEAWDVLAPGFCGQLHGQRPSKVTSRRVMKPL